MKNERIQICRAIAILAVVATHIPIELPLVQIGIRPFINHSVGLFLFLSGYLTKIDEPTSRIYKNRLTRVSVPYLIWTFISSSYHQTSFWNSVFTGEYYYYCIVYIELVLLTPLIQRLLRKKYYLLGFLITPIAIFVEYTFCFIGKPIPFPWYLENPFIWFSLYYVGMCIREQKITINCRIHRIISFYAISLILQLVESYVWYIFGDTIMASTQIKFTAQITTFLVCCICYLCFKDNGKVNKQWKWLVLTGNVSFGVYLIHGIIISILGQIDRWWNLPFVGKFLLVISLSITLLLLLSKLIPKQICKWIGI